MAFSRRRIRTLLAAAVAACLTVLMISAAAPSSVPALGTDEASAACRGARGNPGEITQRRAARAVLCLVNKKRQKHGVRRLKRKSSTDKAARRHTRRMVKTGCFSHQCPGELDLVGRIEATNYLPCNCSWGVGENIAWGGGYRGSPRKIVKAWMNSAGHRANILNRGFKHIGISAIWGAPGDPGANAGTYTTVFGYRD